MAILFGIDFSELRESELVQILAREPVPSGAKVRTVVTANLDHIARLGRQPDFEAAYKNAWIATIDGMPVHAYAKMRGTGISERVTGADLFKALMPRLDPVRHRCVFVASTSETGSRLKEFLMRRGFSASSVLVIVPEFGFESDPAASEILAMKVAAHRATHVFLGVGSPKSEVWAHRYRDRLGDCYVLNIGAALDFFVGTKRRAPMWMHRMGLEWFWRMMSEPKRLVRRYLIDSWGFVEAIRKDLMSST